MRLDARFSYWFRLLFVVSLVVISVLAFIPVTHTPDVNVSDKIQHLAAFFVLLFIADFAFPRLRCGPALLAALIAYGVFIEVVQIALPTREFSWLDIVADGLGILLYKLVREVSQYFTVKKVV